MSVRTARRRQTGTGGDLDDRIGELLGLISARHERAVAELHVHRQPVEPGGELLRQDRRRDERNRLDRRGDVADRVEPFVGGRQIVGLADDRAADVAHDAAKRLPIRHRVVPRDREHLVERPARVTQAASGDHRHERAARGDGWSQHQAHRVAHAARGVLVDDGAVEVLPRQDDTAAGHRQRERDAFVERHPVEVDRHRQRRRLSLGHGAVHEPGDELLDLGRRQLAAVALEPDDLLRQHERRQ